MALIVVGSANQDFLVEAQRAPEAGETVLGSRMAVAPGGKGANQAAAAARLGGDVRFVGCVGADLAGVMLRRSLEEAGVSTGHLRVAADLPTGAAFVLVTDGGENRIVVAAGANEAVGAGDVRAAATDAPPGSVWVTQLEIPVATVGAVAEAAEARDGRFVLNLAPVVDLPTEVVQLADPLVVNEHEASALLGHPLRTPGDVVAAQTEVASAARSAVVTFGSAGAVLVAGATARVVAAPTVAAVDTTGAGDALVGVLAAALAQGQELSAACELAVRAASLSVTRRGAQDSYPTRDELLAADSAA